MLYWLVAIVVLVGLFLWYRRRWLIEPPNAPPLVVLDGSRYKALYLTCTDPGRLIREAQQKYGDIFTLDLIFIKHTITTDADGLHFLYNTKDDKLSFYEVIKNLRGMLGYESVRDRPDHEHIERADKVALTLQRNKKTFFSYIQEEVEQWAAELASRGEPFDFLKEADNLVMNINIHCFLGKDVRQKYSKLFRELYEELENRGVTPSAILFYWLPFGNGVRCKEIREAIMKVVEPIVAERRKRYEETGEEQVDYLNEYITTPHKKTKQPWTLCEMVERTLAIFFAARINTMKSFFWTALGIAVRPDIVQQLDGNDLTYEFIERDLEYIDLCMRETVRPMYAVNPGSRVAQEDIPYKGYVIPKGYIVGASAYCVNRDPKIFPEPEKFIPERWAQGTPLRNDSRVWAFFGGGQHRCRGEKFAYLLLRTTISTLFQKYDLKWIDQREYGQLPSYKYTVALPHPTEPVHATLTTRVC